MTSYTIRIEMYTKNNGEGKLRQITSDTVEADNLSEAKQAGILLAEGSDDFFRTCEVEFSKSQYWFKPLVHVRGECKGKENRPKGFVSAAIMIFWDKRI